MEFNAILTVTVFLPLVGALAIAALIKGDRNIRVFAALIALADLALAIGVMVLFDHGEGAQRFQLVDEFAWIGEGSVFDNGTMDASYRLAVDGLSAPLVLLTGLLGFCAIVGSWNVQLRVKEYFVWLLVLQTAVMGVFVSMDFLLFFLFWELGAAAHVPAHLHMGLGPQRVLGHEVPHVHPLGQRIHVGLHSGCFPQHRGEHLELQHAGPG